ncbi:hypothetical protein PG984_006986 [Apiospora sp. TS-2023a]
MDPADITVDIKAEMRLSYHDHGAGAVEVREEWVKRKVTRRISKANARRRQGRAEEPRLPTRHASRRLDAPREPRPRRGSTAARRTDRGLLGRCRCGARARGSGRLLDCICEDPDPAPRVRRRPREDVGGLSRTRIRWHRLMAVWDQEGDGAPDASQVDGPYTMGFLGPRDLSDVTAGLSI